MTELCRFFFALIFQNHFKTIERLAALEHFFGYQIALTATQLGVKFQNSARQKQRFFFQVVRGVLFVFQHFHNITRFKSRTNSVADRLAAVGNRNINI